MSYRKKKKSQVVTEIQLRIKLSANRKHLFRLHRTDTVVFKTLTSYKINL